jgi:hypothetical protein
MEQVSINELKGKKEFLDNIRWDITPKVFLNPELLATGKGQGKETSNTDGYLLYIEIIKNSPVLVIMQNKYSMSRTVAYVTDVPEDLLRESAHCSPAECVAGMHPVTQKLEDWLKKTLGASKK